MRMGRSLAASFVANEEESPDTVKGKQVTPAAYQQFEFSRLKLLVKKESATETKLPHLVWKR